MKPVNKEHVKAINAQLLPFALKGLLEVADRSVSDLTRADFDSPRLFLGEHGVTEVLYIVDTKDFSRHYILVGEPGHLSEHRRYAFELNVMTSASEKPPELREILIYGEYLYGTKTPFSKPHKPVMVVTDPDEMTQTLLDVWVELCFEWGVKEND